MSEQPGRYQRSFSGLIGAIVITLVAIGGFVAIRAAVRDDIEQKPQAVDYLETVGLAQGAGVDLVHPAGLPEGWIATSVDYQPGPEPAFGVGMLTDDGQFVGMRQEDDALDDLLATFVDEDPDDISELEPETLDSEVATEWQAYEDEGGDRAYAAEVGEEWVLVYGSADLDDLREVVTRLTTDPVGG